MNNKSGSKNERLLIIVTCDIYRSYSENHVSHCFRYNFTITWISVAYFNGKRIDFLALLEFDFVWFKSQPPTSQTIVVSFFTKLEHNFFIYWTRLELLPNR